MGFNYGHGDSLVVSIILLIAVFGIMGIAIFLLNKWTNADSSFNHKTAKTKEIASLAAYIIMVLLTVNGVAHFIAVQTDVKSAVRPQALNRIQELKRIFGNDTKEGSYQSYVSELSATYRNQMKKDYADERTVNLAVSEFEDAMMGEGAYERLKNKANSFLTDCENSVDYWIPWTVTEYLINLDKNSEDWPSELIRLSEKQEWVKTTGETYKPHLEVKESLANIVINPSVSNYSLLSIIVIMVLQAIILFSYLRGKDWSQSGPKRHKEVAGGPIIYRGTRNNSGANYQNTEDEI